MTPLVGSPRLNFVVINNGSRSGLNYPLKKLPWKLLMTKNSYLKSSIDIFSNCTKQLLLLLLSLFVLSLKDETVKTE